jgi:transglutaminase-like putative cysteine protease
MVRLPLWIILWCALMWGYQLLLLRFNWPRPNRFARILLAVLAIGGLLATYTYRLGPNAALGLLAVMAALKPFETATHRDRMVTLFLAYFIVITSLLQSETLAMTLYMFFSVLVTTAVLIRINHPGSALRADLRLAGRIMAQSLPLMVILFLLFPRIQGSLVGFARTDRAESGFSDRLRPGSITRMVENDAAAFRAEFNGEHPPPPDLYWRGIVFSSFDGRGWRRSKQVPPIAELPGGKGRVAYRITLEPHRRRWLFSLDRPGSFPRWSRMYADFTIKHSRSVGRKKRYEMASHTRPGRASDWGVKEGLLLPAGGNPESRQLAASFANRGGGGADKIVSRALSWLRDNRFTYTLRPPALGKDPIDDFLFRTRRGYCEHYASAFAFLMRAAGVPSRVVGGYQGGEVNPYGGYLLIRQSHAHAWVEVWKEKNGWARVDPTAAVVPERISHGPAAALPEGEWPGGRVNGSGALIDGLRLGWDAVSTRWEAWFSSYSRLEQKALLKRLGIPLDGLKGVLVYFLGLCALPLSILAFYAAVQFRRAAAKSDRVGRCYELFLRKLRKQGLSRGPGQGPVDFAEEVARLRPDLAAAAEEITALYIRLRFEQEAEPRTEKAFCRQVKRFRVKKSNYV